MKVLLLSDAPMALQAGGIGQTLYNIFSFSQPIDFMAVAPEEEMKIYPPSEPYTKTYIGYKYEFVKTPRNRIGRALKKYIQWINFSICQISAYKSLQRKIQEFNPDVVVSCPNSDIGVLMHQKLFLNKDWKTPVIPYFMDDWMRSSQRQWLGGNLQEQIAAMLNKSSRWMMISKELTELLSERYQTRPEQVFHIHNPVDIKNAPEDKPYQKGNPFIIAYAGALWQMHFDSFFAVAKAINTLQKEVPVKLVLYTSADFWSWRKSDLEPLNVEYGGHIPYKEIHQTLYKADALLLTSSFSNEMYSHSKASLQTKITDYCKSKRLIISCGPDYSANHRFLREKNCGICIETNEPNLIITQLKEIIKDIEAHQLYVENGWRMLEIDFSKEVIHKNTEAFLKAAL